MDRIEIRNIRVFGKHGANPGERDYEQPFDIDVCIDVDVQKAALSDNLADTLDYAALHEELVRVVQTTSFELLERLAAELLTVVLANPAVYRAEVSVAKPQLLNGATPRVTLVRERSA